VQAIRVITTVPDRALAALAGQFAQPDHYADVIDTDTDVYKPDGTLLLAFRKRAVLSAAWRCAWRAMLRAARQQSPNRGRKLARGGKAKFRSGTMGYLNSQPVNFNTNDPRGWREVQPLIRALDSVFRGVRPAEYDQLRALVARVPKECFAPWTVFTTFAANRSARMGYHHDGGNIEGALGVLSVAGEFTGGLLVFPKYRVAVDLRPGDVLIADNRELHGNTAITGNRVSIVAYAHASNLPT
jgi:hypothetical protein